MCTDPFVLIWKTRGVRMLGAGKGRVKNYPVNYNVIVSNTSEAERKKEIS